MYVTYQYLLLLCDKKNDVCVQYCPTEDMVGNYFIKPLQGSLFCKFHDFSMNWNTGQIDPAAIVLHVGTAAITHEWTVHTSNDSNQLLPPVQIKCFLSLQIFLCDLCRNM